MRLRGARVWMRDLVAGLRVTRRLRDEARFFTREHILRLEVDAGWRLLVLAPHPDDEAIWCGGTIRRVVEAGGQAHVVYLTDGSPPARAASDEARRAVSARRRIESDCSSAILGIQHVHRLDAVDGTLSERSDLAPRLAEIVSRGCYTHVLCPWPRDWHPDHAATFRIFERALRQTTATCTVLLYEAWGTLTPNAAIDIDDVLAVKQLAIAAHASQLEEDDFVALGTALSRYRATCLPAVTHAEAFFMLPSSRLRWF